jgi:hypothetical protein
VRSMSLFHLAVPSYNENTYSLVSGTAIENATHNSGPEPLGRSGIGGIVETRGDPKVGGGRARAVDIPLVRPNLIAPRPYNDYQYVRSSLLDHVLTLIEGGRGEGGVQVGIPQDGTGLSGGNQHSDEGSSGRTEHNAEAMSGIR